MKRTLVFILSLHALPVFCQVQLERSLVSAGGVYAASPSISFEYSIGEPVIATGASASLILTQGFNQPPAGPTGIIPVSMPVSFFVLYPNPAVESIYLEINAQDLMHIEAGLFDMAGRLISSAAFEAPAGYSQTEIFNISKLSPGMYMLHCHDRLKPDAWVSFRIIKI